MRRKGKHLYLDRRERLRVAAVVALILLPVVPALWLMHQRTSPPIGVAADSDLMVPESEIAAGDLRLFSFPVDPRTRVSVLVKRAENGEVQTAFASCRRCFQAGSFQQGDQVICGHCREPMQVIPAGTPVAPEKDCALLPLPFERREGQLIVRRDDIGKQFDRWFRFVQE